MMKNCEIKYFPIENTYSINDFDEYGNYIEDDIVIHTHQPTCLQRFYYCIKRFFKKLFCCRRYRKNKFLFLYNKNNNIK